MTFILNKCHYFQSFFIHCFQALGLYATDFFYAAVDCKTIHKTAVLFRRYVTSLIRISRPLKLSVSKTDIYETETGAIINKPLDPVGLSAAEEKQRSRLKRVKTVVKSYYR